MAYTRFCIHIELILPLGLTRFVRTLIYDTSAVLFLFSDLSGLSICFLIPSDYDYSPNNSKIDRPGHSKWLWPMSSQNSCENGLIRLCDRGHLTREHGLFNMLNTTWVIPYLVLLSYSPLEGHQKIKYLTKYWAHVNCFHCWASGLKKGHLQSTCTACSIARRWM